MGSLKKIWDLPRSSSLKRIAFAAVSLVAVIAVAWSAASYVTLLRAAVKIRDLQRAADVSGLVVAAQSGLIVTDVTSSAPLIMHATFSQVIVSSSDGIVCSDPSRRPACPGQALDDGGMDAKCVVELPVDVVPVDPSGVGHASPTGGLPLGAANSGYFLHLSPGGRIEVGACWPEGSSAIRQKVTVGK